MSPVSARAWTKEILAADTSAAEPQPLHELHPLLRNCLVWTERGNLSPRRGRRNVVTVLPGRGIRCRKPLGNPDRQYSHMDSFGDTSQGWSERNERNPWIADTTFCLKPRRGGGTHAVRSGAPHGSAFFSRLAFQGLRSLCELHPWLTSVARFAGYKPARSALPECTRLWLRLRVLSVLRGENRRYRPNRTACEHDDGRASGPRTVGTYSVGTRGFR
jgi:hypothetical protein